MSVKNEPVFLKRKEKERVFFFFCFEKLKGFVLFFVYDKKGYES